MGGERIGQMDHGLGSLSVWDIPFEGAAITHNHGWIEVVYVAGAYRKTKKTTMTFF